jgi:hypothetical protein
MSLRTLPLAAALLAAGAAPATASCIQQTDAQQVARADVVFVGRVVSVSADRASARFRVLRVRKGPVRKGAIVRVTATPYPSSITIGWRPRKGQRWRVLAQRRGGRWTTDDCMGTRRL